MKRILVAGAAGFLGSHLAKELVLEGNHVIGIDNFITGNEARIRPLNALAGFSFIQADVSSLEALGKIPFPEGLDEAYHLASPASPAFYSKYPFDTIAANTLGTRNLLELCRIHDAKLLYTSTSEVYGDPEKHPQSEDYIGRVSTSGPRACYYESKRMGEVYAFEYHRKYDVAAKVVRIFNTYSADLLSDDGRVISNFLNQALTGRELTIHGNGNQTRSFCYVDDMIRGLRRVMDSDQANGQIINLGNPEEISILNLARLVRKMMNSTSPIKFHPLPEDDPRMRRPDIGKARRLLDWEPVITLEEGLKRAIEQVLRK
jgi:nucleoside-diphosphate-sugar epimerase